MSNSFNMRVGEEIDGYRIVTKMGCKLIFGEIPGDDLAAFCAAKGRKNWLLDAHLAKRIGASIVCGPADGLKQLNEANLPLSDERQAEVSRAQSNAKIPAAVVEWIRNGQRGLSSEALCKHFFGEPADAGEHHPVDLADLNRCLVFLDAAFGTRTPVQIDSVRSISPHWSAYVDHWDELVSLFEKETQGAKGGLWKVPETYNLMLKIQDGVRQQEKVHNRDKSQYRG